LYAENLENENSKSFRHGGQMASAQQNVCAMVAGRQGIKYIYPTTFSHADSGGFDKPPLRKHKR